jgi:hypothetical protein
MEEEDEAAVSTAEPGRPVGMAEATTAPVVSAEPAARKAAAAKAEGQEKLRTAPVSTVRMESLAEAVREGLALHLPRLANTVAPAVAAVVGITAAAAAVAAVSSTTRNNICIVQAAAVEAAARTTSSRASKY